MPPEWCAAWDEYYLANPEVIASWNEQHGYWPDGHVNEKGGI